MKNFNDIINWIRLDDRVTLSGQPTEKQLEDLKAIGVSHIINLGPHHNKGALPDETKSVEQLGMSYTYIPVEFDQPTDANFTAFVSALENSQHDQVHVHCIYNARVTAFFYKYAVQKNDGSAEKALTMMDRIWRPGSVWAEFIGIKSEANQPNQYAGHEY